MERKRIIGGCIGILILCLVFWTLTLPKAPPPKTLAQWKSEGCWTYQSTCKGVGEMVACEKKSEYKHPFFVDGVVKKPYPLCEVKPEKEKGSAI